jgi:hypothetical protein
MSITAKGCTQVKSLASLKKSGTHSGGRHVRHFQVASLEMERSRRLKDRDDALQRLQAHEKRLDEIDVLLRGHYDALGLVDGEDLRNESQARPSGVAPMNGFARTAGAPPETSGAPRRMVLYGR